MDYVTSHIRNRVTLMPLEVVWLQCSEFKIFVKRFHRTRCPLDCLIRSNSFNLNIHIKGQFGGLDASPRRFRSGDELCKRMGNEKVNIESLLHLF